MTLSDLEKKLRAARRDVFSDDDDVAARAVVDIRALRVAIEAHPEERARRDGREAAASERMLRRWA
jgi:hypothetical protein